MHLKIQGNTALHFGMPKQRVKKVTFDVCKKPPKLIRYLAMFLGNFLLSPYIMSMNAENLVKITPTFDEIQCPLEMHK